MISYAQNCEDVIIERFFKNKNNGFYVDVGAADPIIDSVTKHFYDKGWSGINIEPSPMLFRKIAKERIRDINLNIVIANTNGLIDFFDFPNTGLSSIVENNVITVRNNKNQRDYNGSKIEGFDIIKIESRRLENIFEEYVKEIGIDFLKIDAEGAEYEILKSNNWSIYKPKLLIIESNLLYSTEQNHYLWEPIVLQSGYIWVHYDGLNRYYLRDDLREKKNVFSAPLNFFDGFVKYGDIVTFKKRIKSLRHSGIIKKINPFHARRSKAQCSLRFDNESGMFSKDEISKRSEGIK